MQQNLTRKLIIVLATALTVNAQVEVRVSAKPYVPSALTLRVQSDLVEVGVVVRNHSSKAIPGLQKEDFQILDQGTPRDIASFAVETAAGSASITGTASPTLTDGAAPGPRPGSPAARPPRFIALYFDDFGTSGSDLKQAQIAARGFINQGPDAGDRVAVFTSSGDGLDFTADKSNIIAAIDKVRPHPRFSEYGQTICPRVTPFQACLIAVLLNPLALQAAVDEARACNPADKDSTYTGGKMKLPDSDHVIPMIKGQAEQTWSQVRVVSQAILEALGVAVNTLAAKPGRRLLLMVSSGFISGSLERERDALINHALHANIVINALDAKGLFAAPPVRSFSEPSTGVPPTSTFVFETASLGDRLATANEAMTDFAQATGGLFFHNNNDLAAGFHLLGSLPDVSYVLGFHPGDTAEGKYHKLKVRFTASKPYVIEARPR